MFKAIACATVVMGLAACGDVVIAQNDGSDEVLDTETSTALVCSVDARQHYLDGAKATGMTVDESTDPATVIATTQTQKEQLAVLYERQLAELAACSEQ